MQPVGENVIIHDKSASEFWAIYENGTRLLVEMEKKYMMRPKPEIEAPPKKSIQDEDVEQDEKKPP